MRRIVATLGVMALLLAAMAALPFAAANNPYANCVGYSASFYDQDREFQPGLGGYQTAYAAVEYGAVGELASSNCQF